QEQLTPVTTDVIPPEADAVMVPARIRRAYVVNMFPVLAMEEKVGGTFTKLLWALWGVTAVAWVSVGAALRSSLRNGVRTDHRLGSPPAR
ncbi:MAG: hypothetical protein KDD69_17365, partial [Bdellovibrionales bacterium]|nr:hypothetical protein [Bdellovibrionales bacterium]